MLDYNLEYNYTGLAIFRGVPTSDIFKDVLWLSSSQAAEWTEKASITTENLGKMTKPTLLNEGSHDEAVSPFIVDRIVEKYCEKYGSGVGCRRSDSIEIR